MRVTDFFGQLMIDAAAYAGRVQWDKTSVVAHQGDNVTLVCTVRTVDLFDVVRLTMSPTSQYVASLGSPSTADDATSTERRQRWTISDNEVVKSPFVALPRYSVAMAFNGRGAVVSLHFTGELPIQSEPPT